MTSHHAAGCAALIACALGLFGAPAARAAAIIEEWASVKAPPPPDLKPVTVDPKTTAVLSLDFLKQNCAPRPRCVATLPQVEKLLGAAREKNVLVAHSLFAQRTPADFLDPVAPKGDEPVVQSGANKFLRTDLEKILKDKGITTVIVTGTAAHGAVLNTAAAAALAGFKVVLPVDGLSAENPYAEQYAVWHLANAPGGIAPQVTVTRIDEIKF